MVGALWTGISGLAAQQTALDNESNNIANVNTIGYKASRISFADQMYQDKIGKGTTILDAEKLYNQGNLKLTGVSYDMALSGDGFFAVSNTRGSGTAETYYTRAGNFRMGENGTLQDAAGNEVQGWAMREIEAAEDISSTDENATKFTNDFEKLLGSTVVNSTTDVKTFTAKATDYTSTALADNADVYAGAGYKSKSTKISDVELLVTEYQTKLKAYADDPTATSSPSDVQQDKLDYDLDNVILASGDEMYVYIDGTKYSQSFDTSELITIKKLTDQLSNIPGYTAYLSSGTSPSAVAGSTDPLTHDPMIDTTQTLVPGNEGTIVIESLIPGKSFRISEFGWTDASSANQATKGTVVSLQETKVGTGLGAVESARDALSKAVAGKQSDVFSASDITLGNNFEYVLNKNTFGLGLPDANITVAVSPAATLQDIANAINTHVADTPGSTEASAYINAYVLNGDLVIEPIDKYNDKEIDASLTDTTAAAVVSKDSNKSVVRGAGAEFIEIKTQIDQTASRGSLQLKLDSLNISDSAFGEFSVDSTGLVTMRQDGAEFAIGQIAIARFTDNRGLEPIGDNLLQVTNQSGNPIFNINNDKTADVKGRTLELSTADLSESLVNLMVFQRAFEANAKSITTADAILNTLIQLKR